MHEISSRSGRKALTISGTPDRFLCPIARVQMNAPVVMPAGYAYDEPDAMKQVHFHAGSGPRHRTPPPRPLCERDGVFRVRWRGKDRLDSGDKFTAF
ncbi:unnamed protein product [Boreogadus saida]